MPDITPHLTLGLDLGTNSVGWALARESEDGLPQALVGCGVRIFQEAVDAKTRAPKNQARRSARLARRVLARRSRRRAKLRNQLVAVGLLPPEIADAKDPERVLNALGDPYVLRVKALEERLDLYGVGRVLLHLCARRGFQSNRKTRWGGLVDDPDVADLIAEAEAKGNRDKDASADADEGRVLAEVATLREQIEASGARTLGEYLARLPQGERKRARHTDRQMYKDEFETVWAEQSKHHDVMDDALKAELYESIFHQRPLKLSPGRIGYCLLEASRPRTAKARLESQRYRLLLDVNHLAVRDPLSHDDQPLTPEQRTKLAAELDTRQSMTWGAIRKALGLRSFEHFNLEEGSKNKGLTGNTTAAKIRGVTTEWWESHACADRVALVEDLLTIDKKRSLLNRLRDYWGFEREQAFKLAVLELEPGYMNHSLKAINKLLPRLEDGKRYSDARQAAGYDYERDDDKRAKDALGEPPSARNPVVEKALFEVRKVVNAIIREHGKPAVVRVELPRDMKLSPKRLRELDRQQRENQRLNEQAKEKLAEVGKERPARDDLIKYRLWKESGGVCPYTGKSIGMNDLFGPNVDVEHIIPYSRCLDDSYMNKTLCMAEENRQVKGNRTPWEAYHGRPKKWEEILQRVKALPPPKQRRFKQEEVDEISDFVSRQLNDTGYISRLAKDYVGTLGVSIEVTKGTPTAMLRRHWGLNHMLGDDTDQKERGDHRHHALDAAVVAVTSRSTYQRLARHAQEAEVLRLSPLHGGLNLPEPWDGFANELNAQLGGVVVSHAPTRKLVGAFHEDTAYGLRYLPELGAERFVYRKQLDANFTRKMADKVVDPVLRIAIKERMNSVANAKEAFAEPFKHPKNDRQTVRRVRLQENFSADRLYAVDKQTNRNGQPFKHLAYGNNHHVEIFRDTATGRVEHRFVTTMEAARRGRMEKRPIVDRQMDGKVFLMSLSINDMVELDEGGTDKTYRVQNLDPAERRLVLRHHLAARIDDKAERIIVAIGLLIEKRRARKVNVTPLGEIRPAYD